MYLLDTNALIFFSKVKHSFILNRDFTSMLSIVEHPPALRFDNLTILSPNEEDYYRAIEPDLRLKSITEYLESGKFKNKTPG